VYGGGTDVFVRTNDQDTGDTEYADLLEKIAYNALPHRSPTTSPHASYPRANQVLVTRNIHNFDINHGETDLGIRFADGYPCCTSNLHQAGQNLPETSGMQHPREASPLLPTPPLGPGSGLRKNRSANYGRPPLPDGWSYLSDR
jgi:hypothetical protein